MADQTIHFGVIKNCLYQHMLFNLKLFKLVGAFAYRLSGVSIDCYHCTSLAGEHKACEDKFQQDVTTEHMIKRNCYYHLFKAHFCIKLKGTREDGSSILVRQCSRSDWGSHCGLIQYEAGGRLENIDGCLEACNFDGCNLATKPIPKSLTILLTIVSLLSFLLCRSCV